MPLNTETEGSKLEERAGGSTAQEQSTCPAWPRPSVQSLIPQTRARVPFRPATRNEYNWSHTWTSDFTVKSFYMTNAAFQSREGKRDYLRGRKFKSVYFSGILWGAALLSSFQPPRLVKSVYTSPPPLSAIRTMSQAWQFALSLSRQGNSAASSQKDWAVKKTYDLRRWAR